MNKSIKDIEKRKINLIEEGNRALEEVEVCSNRVDELKELLKKAEEKLLLAKSTNGDVSFAQRQLTISEKSLSVAQKNLAKALEKKEQNNKDKYELIYEIEDLNNKEKSNLQSVNQLKSKAFGENSYELSTKIVERINQAEKSRIELLKSLGIDAVGKVIDNVKVVAEKISGPTIVPPNKELAKGLTPELLYKSGIKTIDKILNSYYKKLIELGVEDDYELSRYLGERRLDMLKKLTDAIENNSTYVEFDKSLNLKDAAEYLKAKKMRRSITPKLFTEEGRELNRSKIRSGTMTEKDIREIGKKVCSDYDEFINARNARKLSLDEEIRQSAINNRYSTTSKKDVLKKIFEERTNQISSTYNPAPLVRDIVEHQRPVGPISEYSTQQYIWNSENARHRTAHNALGIVRDYSPREWVTKGNDIPINIKVTNRGYFSGISSSSSHTIALSGNKKTMTRCAFHEMGHRYEVLYPEIVKIEKQFYDRRTAGEELTWLGLGYDKSEKTRRDHFVSPYMGKDYGGDAFELVSMGMEGLYCGTVDMAKDQEFKEMMFGILVSI